MKRYTPRRLRDRRTGKSPYARYGKRPYRYPFLVGKAYAKSKGLLNIQENDNAQAKAR